MTTLLSFFTFDPLYFLMLAPVMLLAGWAQWRVHSAFNAMREVPASTGLTGAEAAQEILIQKGIRGVSIEQVEGQLSDHYDPRGKVLRLSPDVFGGRSLAAVGIAAHEVGHAIQDKEGYGPLVVRNGLVPMASIGSGLSTLLLMVGGIMLSSGSKAGMWVLVVGAGLFAITVLFQLVNLPVEFDASARAKRELVLAGVITANEEPGVNRVLSAAALTYVAATMMAVVQLAYFVIRILGASESRRE